jgi:7-alpha-hydroxysteroid dehydrogenase
VAVVTGAGKGIGRAIAKAYAEAGADVAVASRTEADLESLAREIRGLGRRALAVPTDVMQFDQLDALVARTLDELGKIDVVVNNAGGSPPTPMLQQKDDAFEAAFRFNVTTARHLSAQAIPHMLEGDGGCIVNISSAIGHLVDSGFTAYATAKAAMAHLTRLMACEFAPRVRVNAIGVGAVATSALTPFLSDELREKMESLTPMGRLGEVEDIALMALYLASPASSYVTGKVMEVDGGIESSNWPFDA